MLTATTMTRLEQTIATLLEIRQSAAMDLAAMPAIKQGSQWAADRIRDVEYANRQLKTLGYLPADTAC